MSDFMAGIIKYYKANVLGWLAVLRRGVRILLALLAKFNIYMIIYILACLAVAALSLAHWVGYSIQFNQKVYSTLGSEMRYAFFLPGFLGLLLFVYRVPYRQIICAAMLGLTAVLYILGWINPGWVHTNITLESDYELRYVEMVAYGIALGVMGLTFWEALRDPLMNQSILKTYLYATRSSSLENKNADLQT